MSNKITLTRVKAATKEFIKVLRNGKSDVVTADNFAPFGIDSKPVKEMLALHLQTSNKAGSAVVGYLNNSDKTNPGETRIYCTNDSGVEQFYVLFKNNGTVEFGGTADNFVRYSPLNTNLQQQATDVNTELAKIAAALATVGGVYTPAPITLDISGSKIDEIKSL